MSDYDCFVICWSWIGRLAAWGFPADERLASYWVVRRDSGNLVDTANLLGDKP